MIICENVTGFFRPQYAEEVLSTPTGLPTFKAECCIAR
jgi:hypothetical protein